MRPLLASELEDMADKFLFGRAVDRVESPLGAIRALMSITRNPGVGSHGKL